MPKAVVFLIFLALTLVFTAGMMLALYAPGLTDEQRAQAWKPGLLAINSAIAAMVALYCL